MPNDEQMPISIVAFADALGTEASTERASTASEFLDRLQRATKIVAPRLQRLPDLQNISVRWFSDSIAMTCPLRHPDNLRGILENVAFAQAAFALQGIYLRGAITKGPHHHDEVVDYGPALVQAVRQEKQAGNTTRIIVSGELEYDVMQLPKTAAGSPPLVEDDLGYFLDFLSFVGLESIGRFREQLTLSYKETQPESDPSKKLMWLAAYFNWRTRARPVLPFASDHTFRTPRR